MTSPEHVDEPSRWALVTALSPVLLWVVLLLTAPGFTDPLYTNPPEILGLPAGLVLVGVAFVLAVVGAVIVWRSRSRTVHALAIGLLTIPALLLIGLGPSIVGVLENLSV
jgi:hypothetical protein